MTEEENIDRVVTALLKVPEKKLLIIELANTIPIINENWTTANWQIDSLLSTWPLPKPKSTGPIPCRRWTH